MSRLYLSADIRRAETIATVIGLAARCDPAEITTGQIAVAMGVSQGALFRHFPDKQSIWTAALDWTCSELQRRFDDVLDSPPLARLEAMLAAHIGFIMENPGVPRILWGELQRTGEIGQSHCPGVDGEVPRAGGRRTVGGSCGKADCR